MSQNLQSYLNQGEVSLCLGVETPAVPGPWTHPLPTPFCRSLTRRLLAARHREPYDGLAMIRRASPFKAAWQVLILVLPLHQSIQILLNSQRLVAFA